MKPGLRWYPRFIVNCTVWTKLRFLWNWKVTYQEQLKNRRERRVPEFGKGLYRCTENVGFSSNGFELADWLLDLPGRNFADDKLDCMYCSVIVLCVHLTPHKSSKIQTTGKKTWLKHRYWAKSSIMLMTCTDFSEFNSILIMNQSGFYQFTWLNSRSSAKFELIPIGILI